MTEDSFTNIIDFFPLVGTHWLAAGAGAILILFLLSLFLGQRAPWARALCALAFIAFLVGPAVITETRQAVDSIAAVVVDRSQSQDIGKRKTVTELYLSHIKEQLEALKGIDVRIVETDSASGRNETKLFKALNTALGDVPPAQRAGVILITDGQVHDAPPALQDFGPVHALITGQKGEQDRQVKILGSPAYGITGQDIRVRFIVQDTDASRSDATMVTISQPGGENIRQAVTINAEESIELPIKFSGKNVYQFETGTKDGEITGINNRAAVIVNGIRDRLRVLLVSGQPYAGARTWRDLLTSDPSVDLVHFTILREPDKLDATPSRELSLIAFPFDELFDVKLHEFDLVIFDRYNLNTILPDYYLENIARYVKEGGSFLVANGPAEGQKESIYETPLRDILPSSLAGADIEKPFVPEMSEIGRKHPVTKDLAWPPDSTGPTAWGAWLHQVSLEPRGGDVLMQGADGKPLLILARMGEGRVAQIASDQIWLWARGYQDGGPHAELLRRIIHWLMKEPELDETTLDVTQGADSITVHSRDYRHDSEIVRMTRPDGSQENIALKRDEHGSLEAIIRTDEKGIFAFENASGHKQFAVTARADSPETQAVIATDEILKPVIRTSGGGIFWSEDTPAPGVRIVAAGALYRGPGWIGLRENSSYNVTGVENRPLIPAWMAALVLVMLAVFAWWREGKS